VLPQSKYVYLSLRTTLISDQLPHSLRPSPLDLSECLQCPSRSFALGTQCIPFSYKNPTPLTCPASLRLQYYISEKKEYRLLPRRNTSDLEDCTSPRGADSTHHVGHMQPLERSPSPAFSLFRLRPSILSHYSASAWLRLEPFPAPLPTSQDRVVG
jgi:hypothetical protein